MICAPAASAASITAGRRVSTLIAAPIAASRSIAGMTRFSSSPFPHRGRAGPGAFAADIDDRRAGLEHGGGMGVGTSGSSMNCRHRKSCRA
jgi:hypothetical protein